MKGDSPLLSGVIGAGVGGTIAVFIGTAVSSSMNPDLTGWVVAGAIVGGLGAAIIDSGSGSD